MTREKTVLIVLVSALAWVLPGMTAAAIADDRSYKEASGIAAYLGVLPAAMVQGHPKDHAEEAMHGGVPRGRHAVHVMSAVFDAESGERIEDATIDASVIAVSDAAAHIAGVTRRLEPMVIADTVTYGNYFAMPGDERYRIALSIKRAGSVTPVLLEFSYDHRTK